MNTYLFIIIIFLVFFFFLLFNKNYEGFYEPTPLQMCVGSTCLFKNKICMGDICVGTDEFKILTDKFKEGKQDDENKKVKYPEQEEENNNIQKEEENNIDSKLLNELEEEEQNYNYNMNLFSESEEQNYS